MNEHELNDVRLGLLKVKEILRDARPEKNVRAISLTSKRYNMIEANIDMMAEIISRQ